MEALLETKIFKVSVERLLLNGGQTLYMVGIALLIGTVLGTLLALVLVLCRKGGLVKNKVLHSIVSLYINVVRSVPFIILLVTIMPLTRAILGTTIGSTAALVPLVVYSGVDPSAVTQDDIVENPKNLEFVEMKSLTIPAAIQDFDYVIITGSIVYNAGIDPSAALATEDILDHLILQVVVKEGNKNADWAQAIVDAYHSDRFKAYLEENNDGLWWVPEELQ